MRNSRPDDSELWYRSDRSDDVLTELPSLWGATGELECDPGADCSLFTPDPPRSRASGSILAALSWLLQFFIEGFAACGYAMCPHVIDPNETFDSRAERRRAQDAAPRDGGMSQEVSGKWQGRGH
jgi:hypothetical protein